MVIPLELKNGAILSVGVSSSKGNVLEKLTTFESPDSEHAGPGKSTLL